MTGVAGRLVVERPAKGVAVLRIERPERRGALSPEILEALREAFAAAGDGCLVVTGTGEIFSAGYDLSGIGDPVDPGPPRAARRSRRRPSRRSTRWTRAGCLSSRR